MTNDPQPQSSLTIGDIEGGILHSILAGRDVNVILQVVQQAGLAMPSVQNQAALLQTLRQSVENTPSSVAKVTLTETITALEQALAARPVHERAYLQRVRDKYNADANYYVELTGKTIEAEKSEPQSRSARRRQQRAHADYCEWIEAGREIKQVKLDTLRAGVDKYPTIILLGDPGSGKTTALEHLTCQVAADQLSPPSGDKTGLTGYLPLLLRLSEFGPGQSLIEFISQSWAGPEQAGHWAAPELAANLEGYLAEGRLFILFDALNETPREGYTERAAELRRFIDHWQTAGNRFMVSCRVLDYGQELQRLQRIEVQPLSDEQIENFVVTEMVSEDDTCEALWQQLKTAEDETEQKQLNEQLGQELEQRGLLPKWQKLWDTLTQQGEAQRRLLEMARNPYLLTMIIDVFLEDGALSNNRVELMTRFTQIQMIWAKGKTAPGAWLSAAAQRESLLHWRLKSRNGPVLARWWLPTR